MQVSVVVTGIRGSGKSTMRSGCSSRDLVAGSAATVSIRQTPEQIVQQIAEEIRAKLPRL